MDEAGPGFEDGHFAAHEQSVDGPGEAGPQLAKHYGSRSDGFYLRFLQFKAG